VRDDERFFDVLVTVGVNPFRAGSKPAPPTGIK
jgi:hypothetical protein